MAHLYAYDGGARIRLRSGKRVYVEKHDRVVPETGQSNTPDIPIVFVHGFENTIKTWMSLLPQFKGHTRIVFDCEPYGRTGPQAGEGPITISSHARDVHDILAHFGYASGQVILVGHSSGALISIQFAHDFPERTRKIVLLGPLHRPTLNLMKEYAARGFMLTVSWEALLAQHLSWLGSKKRHDPALLALIESEMRAHEDRREAQHRYFEGVADMEIEDAGGVEAWIIKGTQDSAAHPEAAPVLAKLLDAEVLELDTGHYFSWEDPDATVNAIRTALQSNGDS